jgi:LacI family transcriptional regulator
VEQAIADLQYVPNVLAQTLRSGKDKAIGVAVPDLADPFFAGIVRAVEQAARRRGSVVLVTSLGEDPAEERPAVEALLRRQISGLILAPTSADHSYLEARSRQTGLVFVDRPPRHLVADSVIEDDRGGAAGAVRHLIEGGHRRIAFLAPQRQVATTRRRHDGYRAAIAEAGLVTDERLEIFYVDRGTSSVQACQDLLALPDPPTAMFCGNSATSVEVVPLLHQIGRTDVALVSFGDFPMAALLRPSVSAIDQSPAELGQAAADRLFQRIDEPGRRLKRHVVLPVSLTVRESSEIPGPAARSALRRLLA